MQLDLTKYVARGIKQLEEFLLKHALFDAYCEKRDRNHAGSR